MPTAREQEIYDMPGDTYEQRELKNKLLIELALDEMDEYDGHHGKDSRGE